VIPTSLVRVILLKNGTAEAYDTVAQVQDLYGGSVVKLTYTGTIPPSPHYEVTVRETNYAELTLTDGVDPALVVQDLVASGVLIRGFRSDRPSLEDIFIRVYGDQNDAAGQ